MGFPFQEIGVRVLLGAEHGLRPPPGRAARGLAGAELAFAGSEREPPAGARPAGSRPGRGQVCPCGQQEKAAGRRAAGRLAAWAGPSFYLLAARESLRPPGGRLARGLGGAKFALVGSKRQPPAVGRPAGSWPGQGQVCPCGQQERTTGCRAAGWLVAWAGPSLLFWAARENRRPPGGWLARGLSGAKIAFVGSRREPPVAGRPAGSWPGRSRLSLRAVRESRRPPGGRLPRGLGGAECVPAGSKREPPAAGRPAGSWPGQG